MLARRLLALPLLAAVACGGNQNGSMPDAAVPDANSSDGGAGGTVDAADSIDAATAVDAADPIDAAASIDAAIPDAEPPDAELPDAVPPDAAPPDAIPQVTLSVSATASGTVTSDVGGIDCDDTGATVCAADFDLGTVVTLTATAAMDYAFDGWTGDCSGTNPTIMVTVDAAKSCGAAFYGVSGNIQVIPPPVSVVPNVTESNTDILVFQEQADLTLSADIPLDVHMPSTYANSKWTTPGVVPAGTRVNVYFLHFDPTSTVQKTGSITLPNPIIGTISSTANLEATDGPLGTSGVAYPAAGTAPDRQIELSTNDAYTLSADRHTVSIDVNTSTSADQIRIVTLAPGETMPVHRYDISDISPPSGTAEGTSEDSSAVQLFLEQTVTLSADLAVDATSHRLYTGTGQLNAGTIAAGTSIKSYLVHFDPAPPGTVSLQASLYFEGDILGIQVLDATLDAGATAVGAAGTTYASGGGLEFSTDAVRLGDEGRGLWVRGQASTGVDDIRVIIAN